MDFSGLIVNFILITFLGLLIAFNPSLIILSLFLVIKSRNPIRDTLILAVSVILPLLILALIGIFWLKPDSSFSIGNNLNKFQIPPLIDLVFGLALVIYANFRHNRTPKKIAGRNLLENKIKRLALKPGSIFFFGFIRSCLSITTLLAVLIISKIIVTNDPNPLSVLVAIIWAVIIGVSPLIGPSLWYRHNPHSMEKIQASVDKLMSRDANTIVNVLLGLIGLGFLINGLIKLSGGS